MIGGDAWVKKIEKRGERDEDRKKEEVASFLEKKKNTKEADEGDDQEAVQEKNRSESKRGRLSFDGADSINRETLQKLGQGLANHFVVGKIEKKIAEQEKGKQNSGENNGFERIGFDQGPAVGMKNGDEESKKKNGKAFNTGKGKERSAEKNADIKNELSFLEEKKDIVKEEQKEKERQVLCQGYFGEPVWEEGCQGQEHSGPGIVRMHEESEYLIKKEQ